MNTIAFLKLFFKLGIATIITIIALTILLYDYISWNIKEGFE